jgi:hypothetical protein
MWKRLKALQGSWVETKGRGKKWLVEGEEAVQVLDSGKKGKRYTLSKDANGDTVWGLDGKYTLDRAFTTGSSTAEWWDATSLAFSWTRLAGDATAGNASDSNEKRVDPADGKAYTLQQLRAYYSATYGTPFIETTQYWMGLEAAGKRKGAGKGEAQGKGKEAQGKGKAKAAAKVEEKRIDASDGKAYTLNELRSFYADVYKKRAIDDYWKECKVKGQAQPDEKRIDPGDGKVYTLQEMRAFYSSRFTKKETEAYWSTCKLASAGKGGKKK